MTAITVDNLGTAGAEVPVIVKFVGGEVSKRLEVRAKGKATIRIEAPGTPQEIVINDGSVPESDLTNNVFKIAPTENHGTTLFNSSLVRRNVIFCRMNCNSPWSQAVHHIENEPSPFFNASEMLKGARGPTEIEIPKIPRYRIHIHSRE
jgi:hypothetical protein